MNFTELPTKFTLGTELYCITLANETNCFQLPPDIATIFSNLLPALNKGENFRPIIQVLKYIPLETVRGLIITSIILINIIFFIFIFSFYFISRLLKIIFIILNFICFSLFFFIFLLFYILAFKAQKIFPFIISKIGLIGLHSFWTLICIIIMNFCMFFII